MMRILVALDSFKGSLTAFQACEIVKNTICSINPNAIVETLPLADGGEGTAECLLNALGGKKVHCKVMGPLPCMEVDSYFVLFEKENIALVEMAVANGLTLIPKDLRNPLKTTTYGTGQLIKEAAKYRPERILVAVGGSATVDAGVGAAMALGWEFLDSNGRDVGVGGEQLDRIKTIGKPQNSIEIPIDVLCDVTNPIYGKLGAAVVFGPQKGADADAVQLLDSGMQHICRIVKENFSKDININGSGAAGGLSGGLFAFTDANLGSGISIIGKYVGLDEKISKADYIITGEGCFDSQSLNGKVVSGVACIASKYRKPVYVLAGGVKIDREQYLKSGIIDAIACAEDGDVDLAMRYPAEYLAKAAKKLFTKVLKH